MNNLRELMKQAQAMQEQLQRELGELVIEASLGGGVVTVKRSLAKPYPRSVGKLALGRALRARRRL